MTLLAWLALGALADEPTTLRGLEVTPQGFRASYDTTLFVRRDGNLYLEDRLVFDSDVAREVQRLVAARPETRVVVSADPGAPWDRVIVVLDLVQSAGVGRVALEVGRAVPAVDPMFPGDALDGAEELDGLTDEQQDRLAPKHHRFAQNPYGSTDFTAYTREWGEAKIGLTSLSYGILPRVQVGTVSALDLLGVYNASAKGNFVRTGPLDLAISGSVYAVPITDLLERFDQKGTYKIAGYKVKGKDIFVDRITYFGLSLHGSLQLVGGWSAHTGVGYARASAKGALDFQNLPTVVLPGLDPIGGELTLVPNVVGELIDLRFATDYRFNRRDSLILQAAATVYGRARGGISGGIDGLPRELRNLDFIVGYGQAISPWDSYRASLAWQFSWKTVDLRFGLGASAVPYTWLLQSFELSYRFGGETRKGETEIQRGYRDIESRPEPAPMEP